MVKNLRPSIVVQTVTATCGSPRFFRWFEAVLGALGTAHGGNAIAAWRVSVGDIGVVALDEPARAELASQALAAGGEFDYTFFGAALGAPVVYMLGQERLTAAGSEDLVLILRPEAVVLPSTIIRMLGALKSDIAAVDARRLPVEALDGLSKRHPNQLSKPHARLPGRPLLFRRAMAADGGAPVAGAWPEPASALHCPEAVVFHDDRDEPSEQASPAQLSDRSSELSAETQPESGSLLETLLGQAGFAEAEASVARALTVSGPPLLSIVMRTQVLRPEALREVLLCLAGQTDGRFELLLVAHNAEPGGAENILAEQPRWLRSRTRVLASTGGTRSHPLNDGIAAARGSLISFLDDDDLVFGHWVETFLSAAEHHPRQVLRAAAGVQWATTIAWPGGIEGHRTESALSAPYPARFDLVDHLKVNMTPLMAYAIPRKFFELGGGADETLQVCEDWDLGLRAASLLGVVDILALTAIYRRWNSGQDSYSRHDESVWRRDMEQVRRKLDAGPMLVPAGIASELARLPDLKDLPAQLAAAYDSTSWRATAPLRLAVRFAAKLWRRLAASLSHIARG